MRLVRAMQHCWSRSRNDRIFTSHQVTSAFVLTTIILDEVPREKITRRNERFQNITLGILVLGYWDIFGCKRYSMSAERPEFFSVCLVFPMFAYIPEQTVRVFCLRNKYALKHESRPCLDSRIQTKKI